MYMFGKINLFVVEEYSGGDCIRGRVIINVVKFFLKDDDNLY